MITTASTTVGIIHRTGGSYLSGQHVADNWMVGTAVEAGYDLKLPGFNYFSLDLGFLSTLRQDLEPIYIRSWRLFQPRPVCQCRLGAQFSERRGRSFVVRGRFVPAYQYFKESSSPCTRCNRLANGYERAGSPTVSGQFGVPLYRRSVFWLCYDLELKGVYLLDPHWLIAAGGAVRQTSGFQDYFAGFSIRFLLDSRKAAFSSDIPESFFKGLY